MLDLEGGVAGGGGIWRRGSLGEGAHFLNPNNSFYLNSVSSPLLHENFQVLCVNSSKNENLSNNEREKSKIYNFLSSFQWNSSFFLINFQFTLKRRRRVHHIFFTKKFIYILWESIKYVQYIDIFFSKTVPEKGNRILDIKILLQFTYLYYFINRLKFFF